MFNRENKKDIENATNIFRTIAAEMGFRKEPINTVILGWEEWDENVEPSAFGMMAKPSIPVNHEGVVMLFNNNDISLYVIDIRRIKSSVNNKIYSATTDLSNLEKELKFIFSQYCKD